MAKNTMQNIWADKQKESERLAKKLERKKANNTQVKKSEDAQPQEPKS